MASQAQLTLPAGLLAFAVFLIGLIGSFALGGMFGMAPPAFWAALVIMFTVGVYLLANPKRYIYVLLIYYGLFYNGTLFGKYSLGIPSVRLLDEALLAIPAAVLVMKAVNRELPRGATAFPLLYGLMCFLSYKAQHPPMVSAFRVILSYGKFYIYWYFARAIGPWTLKAKRRYWLIVVGHATVQFFMNVFWQKGFRMIDSDLGIGTIGSAHLVGYISTYALFMLAGRLIATDAPLARERLLLAGIAAALIGYNLVFLTDTKHVLYFLPLAGVPFLFHSRVKLRLRMAVILASLVLAAGSFFYLAQVRKESGFTLKTYWLSMKHSAKGEVFRALAHVLPHEVPYFHLLGTGPGTFCSWVAVYSFMPLAQEYIVPYIIDTLREGGVGRAEASVVGSPVTSVFVLWGEFGLITTTVYAGFWAHAILHLWRKASKEARISFAAGQRLALVSCLLVVVQLALLIDVLTLQVLILPLWTLVGVHWDDSPVPLSQPSGEAARSKERVAAGPRGGTWQRPPPGVPSPIATRLRSRATR